METEQLTREIENCRRELVELAKEKGSLLDPEVQAKSRELDVLLARYLAQKKPPPREGLGEASS